MADNEQVQAQAGEQAGQPEPQSEQTNVQQPEYLTKQEAVNLVNELAAKQFQALQSMQAKQENRVKDEVEKRLQVLTAAGLTPTPEQAARIQDATRQQFAEMDEANTAIANQGDAQAPMMQQQAIHPVIATANEIMRKAGVTINDNDPELKLIDQNTDDELTFLNSVQSAVIAKAKRLADARQKQFDPAKTPGALGAGDQSNLMAQYQKELAANQGNVEGVWATKQKYRKQGLKI